ncbi:MAG: hypothetical protein ACQEQI_06025 [Bacillota bacterium]
MKHLKKATILVMIVATLLMSVGCNQSANLKEDSSINRQDLITQLNLDEEIEIILSKSEDVTGDEVKDKIILTGKRAAEKSPFFDDLTIVVQDGESKEYSQATYENFSGYEPKILIKDFSGDKVGDVMVTASSGGSGGIVNHLIATFQDNQAQVIFDDQDNQGVKVAGTFMPDFKAKLKFEDINKEAILDLTFNKDKYIKRRIYNEDGLLVKRMKITPYSDPFSSLEAIDYNGDGTYELRGHQRIVGAYGADKISEVESIWQYQDNNWDLKELQYSNYLLKYNQNQVQKFGILGSIEKIETGAENKRVLVAGQGINSSNQDKIMLLVNEDTELVTENESSKIEIDDLEVGMKVKAYHREAVTMSIPPQSVATKIIIVNN